MLGLYSLYADAKIQVTAEEITSEVKKKVNSDDFGTLITQNAVYVFVKMPSDKQLNKVREWLLYAVTKAEKELGGGTGQRSQ